MASLRQFFVHFRPGSGFIPGTVGKNRRSAERWSGIVALREREGRLRCAAQAAGLGIYDVDFATGQIHWSPEMRAIAGLPPADAPISIQDLTRLLHPDDRERVLAKIAAASDPHIAADFEDEHRLLRPDGTLRWVKAKGRTFFSGDNGKGRPVGCTGVVIDITEIRAYQEALQRANDELERRVEERTAQLSGANEELVRSNLELQQFAYIAAHDLQTPLRSINGFAQLLQQEFQGKLNDQADVWIVQLMHHVERMHELIKDLLVYSGGDSPPRPFGITDFGTIFDDAVASLQATIAESGAIVTRGDLPAVMGDRIQLAQALQNLIDNGIKYRSSKPPRIHVSARRQEGEWVFAVADNGIGIARKHHQRIFEIFRRLHSQQAYPGTGIGLAVCRRVIQRHGGRIWVESEPGQGSTFYFTLPADLSPAAEPEGKD